MIQLNIPWQGYEYKDRGLKFRPLFDWAFVENQIGYSPTGWVMAVSLARTKAEIAITRSRTATSK